MALLWVLFGGRCNYYRNIYKIHSIMDLPEVQQLCTKFTPEIVRRITWAIIDNGRSFFNTVLTQQDFNSWCVITFPQSFLAGVLENIRFCNPIQRGNFPTKWLGQARNERTQTPRGVQLATGKPGISPGRGGTHGGGNTGGGGGQGLGMGRHGSPLKQNFEEFGGTTPGGGSPGGGGGRRWTPPTPDPCHPKIATLMNPYLAPAMLDTGNIRLEDLPTLEKFRNERTGGSTMCWVHVLGPCHYADCYFCSRGGHPDQADYMDQFADKVVAVIGPAVSARMLALSRSTGDKKVKTEPGTSA
jgi:hypothetical protein